NPLSYQGLFSGLCLGISTALHNRFVVHHQQLPVYHPTPMYDAGRDGSEKKIRECVICMMDFVYGDPIRFLPCMHIYHMDCIDDWLMRSFTCPSCMEPVDAALLSSYETN
ncbi:unnamed protein product, partial [Coregonus sp. 'balchen']